MGNAFGRGVIRPWAVGLILAMLGGGQGAAQELPPCQTTAGEEGLVFAGAFSLIQSPVDFATARSGAEAVQVFGEVRDGLGVLVLGAESGPEEGSGGVEVQVTFAAKEGAVVHACAVNVLPFDPTLNDPAQLSAGDCNLTVIAGLPQLVMSHAQVIEVPRVFEKLGVAAPQIADMASLSERRFYLLGKRPGTTVLIWTEREPTGSLGVNLCPIPVASPDEGFGPAGPGDDVLCQDEQGAPVRLAVGQTARMVFRDAGGTPMEYGEYSVANPAVADFSFEFGAEAGMITAIGNGSTSLTLLTSDGKTAVNCEISVE